VLHIEACATDLRGLRPPPAAAQTLAST